MEQTPVGSLPLDVVVTMIGRLTIDDFMKLYDTVMMKFGYFPGIPLNHNMPQADEWDSWGGPQYSIILLNTGGQKIQCIKEIRAYSNLGLIEAKNLVDKIPAVVLLGLDEAQSSLAMSAFESHGAHAVRIKI